MEVNDAESGIEQPYRSIGCDRRQRAWLTTALTKEDVTRPTVCLMASCGMEMREVHVLAAAPRRLLGVVHLFEGSGVIGVAREPSRVLALERVDVAAVGA